jgi:hypothetical protein
MARNLNYSSSVVVLHFKDGNTLKVKYPDEKHFPSWYSYKIAIPASNPIFGPITESMLPQESQYFTIESNFKLSHYEKHCNWRWAHYHQI